MLIGYGMVANTFASGRIVVTPRLAMSIGGSKALPRTVLEL